MLIDLAKATHVSAAFENIRGGGEEEVPPLSAYCIRGAELTEAELRLALRWLALPLELREASLNHVQSCRDDHG